MTVTIKFSHRYTKMPREFLSVTFLVGVSVCDIEKLPEPFLAWDTHFYSTTAENYASKHYPLPRTGRFMVLTLYSMVPAFRPPTVPAGRAWTTIRSWDAAKEDYYRALMGQPVKIEIENAEPPMTPEEYATSVKSMETLDGWKKCPSCGNSQWRVNWCSQCGHPVRDLSTATKQATL